MMRSLWAGVSGLQNHQTRMDVLGNNISNVNTIGFKKGRVTFQDIFSQTGVGAGINGAGNPQQVGLGTQIAGIDQMFSQGSLQSTGLVTDVAIQGNGFFVVADRADYLWALDVIRTRPRGGAEVLLSPVHGRLDPRDLCSWMLADRVPARLNLQLHKLVYGPDARGV